MVDQPEAPSEDGADEQAMWDEALKHMSGEERSSTVQVPEEEPEEPQEPETKDAPPSDEDGGEAEPGRKEPDQDEPRDVWADAPEDLRKEYEKLAADRDKLKHKWNSDRARVASLNRQLEQARQQSAHKPTAQRQEGNALQDMDAALARLREEYPEIGENLTPFAETLRTIRGELEPIAAAQRAAAETEAQSYANEQQALLEERHPDWLDTLSQNAVQFQEWLGGQPSWLRSIYSSNEQQITDAEGVSVMLERFKRDALGTDSPPPPSPPKGGNPDPRASQRQRQLRGASSAPTGRRTSAPEPQATDPDAIWAEAARYTEQKFPTRQ